MDEDTRDCNTIDYELTLVTNVSTEISTELETSLSTELEMSAALALREHLKGIFTDFAHDVDLSFYDVVGDSLRLHHEEHIMDANQSSYSLNIPVRSYMHTALANLLDNPQVTVAGDDFCHRARLKQPDRDTLDSHTTGLYTARLPMDIQDGVDQNFSVHLYMANAATAVVVDTAGCRLRDLRLFTTGFASGFSVCDSIYHFEQKPPLFRMEQLPLPQEEGCCFTSIHFPSRNPADASKSVIDSQDPFVSEDARDPLWYLQVYATLADGSVTRTVLGVTKPLLAGQLEILKLKVIPGGEAQPVSGSLAGVAVTLDWGPGMEHEVDL